MDLEKTEFAIWLDSNKHILDSIILSQATMNSNCYSWDVSIKSKPNDFSILGHINDVFHSVINYKIDTDEKKFHYADYDFNVTTLDIYLQLEMCNWNKNILNYLEKNQ